MSAGFQSTSWSTADKKCGAHQRNVYILEPRAHRVPAPRAYTWKAQFFGALGVKILHKDGRALKLTVLRGRKCVMANGWVDGDDTETHTHGRSSDGEDVLFSPFL